MKTFWSEVLRWILRAFVFPVLTLLIVLIVAFNFIPQAELRAFAAKEIGRRIDRQMEIGVLHWGLRGLSIDELKVSEVPSFQFGTLFIAKGIRLGWDLRSLWEGLDVRKKVVTKSSGHFHIDDFKNPHYLAHDFSVRWSLSEIDPSFRHVNGWAKLEQGPGLLQNIDRLMATSRSAKIALAPVLALMNLEKLGFLKLGLPDLTHWPIQDIRGRYTFQNGRMTIEPFAINSPQLGMRTTGTVDLGSGNLLLDVQLHAPQTTVAGSLEVKLRISGTLSNPKVDMDSLKKKAFRATVSTLLDSPGDTKKNINAAIKNLFH